MAARQPADIRFQLAFIVTAICRVEFRDRRVEPSGSSRVFSHHLRRRAINLRRRPAARRGAAASLGREIAAASVDEAAAGIALQTTQTFGRLVASEAAKRAADAGLESARQDLTRAEHRRDSGMATDADVLSLVVHVADLQQRAIEASSGAAVARAELNRLMGAAVDAPLVAAMPTPGALPSAPDVTTLLTEADAVRPEIKRAMGAARLAEKNQAQATAALIPQVAAQAAYELFGTQFGDRAASWIVGGEIRWTFSTGGAELASRKAAAAAIDARNRGVGRHPGGCSRRRVDRRRPGRIGEGARGRRTRGRRPGCGRASASSAIALSRDSRA